MGAKTRRWWLTTAIFATINMAGFAGLYVMLKPNMDDVQVMSITPQGETGEQEPIMVTFSQPMIEDAQVRSIRSPRQHDAALSPGMSDIGSLQEQMESDEEVMDLNLWEGDRIFLPWLDQPEFFSAKFNYENGVFQSHSVIFYPAK